MTKIKKLVSIFFIAGALVLTSCSGSDEKSENKSEKSPEKVEDYADRFCECMQAGNPDDCDAILVEAQEKFPEGEKAFVSRLENCDLEDLY